MSVAEAILQELSIWLLLQEDGSVRLAVPASLPTRRLFGDRPPTASGFRTSLPLPEALALARDFLDRMAADGQRWLAVVSAPSATPSEALASELSERGGRSLEPHEFEALQATGMDLPLGEWADPFQSRIIILESKTPAHELGRRRREEDEV